AGIDTRLLRPSGWPKDPSWRPSRSGRTTRGARIWLEDRWLIASEARRTRRWSTTSPRRARFRERGLAGSPYVGSLEQNSHEQNSHDFVYQDQSEGIVKNEGCPLAGSQPPVSSAAATGGTLSAECRRRTSGTQRSSGRRDTT